MSDFNLPPVNHNYASAPTETGGTEGPSGPAGAPRNDPPADPAVPEAPGNREMGNRGFVPDASKGNVDMADLKGLMVGTLSPGAMLAALCVKDAAQQNELNTKELMENATAVQKDIMNQAKKIEDGAYKQMCFAIAGAVASAVGSVASAKVTVSGGAGDALIVSKAKGDAVGTIGGSIGSSLNAIGQYLNSKEQAEVKKLDAAIEQRRTMMESVKTTMQAQRDLISKSIEFMSSMQANMNQTMSRILG